MYSRGKIYKIVSPSNPDLVYYGATVNDLHKRFAVHRSAHNNTNSKLIMCYDDACIVLVENFSCKDKNELRAKEVEYILGNNCVNKTGKGAPSRNKEYVKDYNKEYKLNHLERSKEYNKTYYETNKERLKEKAREKQTCVCGGKYTMSHKAEHEKTYKHNRPIRL
jgi:hypothetical protein